MKKQVFEVIKSSHVTEKVSDLTSASNQYAFKVKKDSSKREIKKAVEEMFGVKVLRVNTMYRKGKKKRFGYVIGQQSTRKIAIVTLAEGDTIEAFGV